MEFKELTVEELTLDISNHHKKSHVHVFSVAKYTRRELCIAPGAER